MNISSPSTPTRIQDCRHMKIPMSPFRVDYAGNVIDLSSKDDDEAVMDVDESHSYASEDLLLHTTNKPCHQDQTIRTELESLSSSNSSACGTESSSTPPIIIAPPSPSNNSPRLPKRNSSQVSFSQIHIREYPIIVGDNPSVLTGTPVTIDWEFVEEMEFAVDEYEQGKPTAPRTMVELRMPASHRDAILKKQGFSLSERNHGKKMANIAKSRRRRTSETMALSKAAEQVELWTRATKNATWGRSRKQQERNYLQPFVA